GAVRRAPAPQKITRMRNATTLMRGRSAWLRRLFAVSVVLDTLGMGLLPFLIQPSGLEEGDRFVRRDAQLGRTGQETIGQDHQLPLAIGERRPAPSVPDEGADAPAGLQHAGALQLAV